ncbi:restriction endonuclease subunit S [Rhizobium leguminosarum]
MSPKVPERWEIRRLGDLCRPASMSVPVSDAEEYDLLGVRWYGNGCHLHSKVKGADLKTRTLNRVQASQIVYNKMWVSKGAFAVVPKDLDGAHATSEYPNFIVKHDRLDPHFIEHYMRQEAFKENAILLCKGSTSRARLNPSDFLDMTIWLPPLHEQRRIAEILSSVDEAIAATRAVIEQTKKVKQGALERLLTKGIGHTRFKQTEIGEIPEVWDVVELIDASEAVTVGIASSATHAYRANGIPMLRNQNIKAGILELSDLLFVSPEYDTENASKRVKTGDVVSMRTGYPGRSAVIPPELDGCQTFTTLVTKPKQSLMNSDFLCAWINSDGGMKQVRRLQAGGAQQNLNAGVLKKLLVPLPPLPEQQQIALSAQSLLFDEEQEIGALDELKSALMSDLLTGRNRVTDALPLAAE